jgi:hypothetical protein
MLQTTSSNGTIRDIWNLPGKKRGLVCTIRGKGFAGPKNGDFRRKNTATLMQIYTF